MAFTVTPDITYAFNSFTNIEFLGVQYLWSAILALIVVLAISTERDHIKITFFPTVVLLHLFGLYQNSLIILISAIIFITSSLSYQVLNKSITIASTFTKDTSKALGEGLGAVYDRAKHGLSLQDSLLSRRLDKEALTPENYQRRRELQLFKKDTTSAQGLIDVPQGDLILSQKLKGFRGSVKEEKDLRKEIAKAKTFTDTQTRRERQQEASQKAQSLLQTRRNEDSKRQGIEILKGQIAYVRQKGLSTEILEARLAEMLPKRKQLRRR